MSQPVLGLCILFGQRMTYDISVRHSVVDGSCASEHSPVSQTSGTGAGPDSAGAPQAPTSSAAASVISGSVGKGRFALADVAALLVGVCIIAAYALLRRNQPLERVQ
jgi:hypothetical protein